MESDRMVNSNVSRKDLDSEFSVVRNEFEMGENNPVGVLMERMVSAAYIWHNYGKSTIGSKSDIERVGIPALRAFYKNYYQPDNAMLVIAGNFKPKNALKLVENTFGKIPRPTRKLDDTYTIEPVQDGPKHVELRRNGDVAACGVVYHVTAATHPDFAAIQIIEQVLADEPSGRLYKEIVESGMASNVSGFAFGLREPGLALHLAEVRAKDPVQPVLDKMISVIEGMGTKPITDEEVNRAKRQLLKRTEMALKNSGRIGVQLSESAAAGDWRLFFVFRDRIEKITADHVRRVAAYYFKPDNRTSGIFIPTKVTHRAEIPQAPSVASLVDGYKGKKALAQGEKFEATPSNIERRIRRTTLANGMKLALLPKETRGDGVQATITLHFGTESDIRGQQTALALIPEMLMRGSKNHTYQQLRDSLDKLKATVRMSQASRTGNAMSINIQTDRGHLAKVINLVDEVLATPTFATDEFDIVKKENLTRAEDQLSDPRALGFNYVFRALNPWPSDDVRYVPTIAETVERLRNVQVDDLRAIHKDLFGANNAEMTIVGDFNPDEIAKTVSQTLGQWKSAKPYKRIAQKFRGDIKGNQTVINTPDKKMAMVACGVNVEMRDDDPDFPAMHLANYILGASAKSRLLNRLRQKEGLSYGAGSFLQTSSEDHAALFAGMAICAPQNAEKAHASLVDEFNVLVREGVGADELASAKKSFAKKEAAKLANDRQVVGMINDGLHLGRTMEYYKALYKSIEHLTPEQISTTLKKYIATERMVSVKAGDLAKPDKVD